MTVEPRDSMQGNSNFSSVLNATARIFFLFTVLALAIESGTYFPFGRWIANCLVIGYFVFQLYFANLTLRWLMIHMLWLSYLGELLLCEVLEMYSYRTPGIPLYVPFGHAIVYASGTIWAHQNWAIQLEVPIRKAFIILFALAFLSVGIGLNDYFTLACGGLFFLLLRRKRWQNLYFFIAVCVIFIELVGTYLHCWTWKSKIVDRIPTVNPPIGAVLFYVGGDVLLAKIVQKVNKLTI
ncbi:MAG: hypothetical protein RL607_1778 [Bacteroidota bacterium]